MGKRVLVTGVNGYVGRHLLPRLSTDSRLEAVAITCRNKDIGEELAGRWNGVCDISCTYYCMDIETGEGIAEAIADFKPTIVVNLAAMSMPAACVRQPEVARAVNAPSHLLNAIPDSCLFVHLSTDQVYEGTKGAPYVEGDDLQPVNDYGTSKAFGEETVRKHKSHAILRSSVIYGPPAPVERTLFLQWMDNALSNGQETTFFKDEFRNAVYIKDVVDTVVHFIASHEDGAICGTYNVGGPQRLSRVDMARMLCALRGYPEHLILPVLASESNRPMKSPLDISMSSAKLAARMGHELTAFDVAIREIFGEPNRCPSW